MNVLQRFVGHLTTITRHRHKVMAHCAKAGILGQGLLHDLSKYSPTEFIPGVRFYSGKHSPTEDERREYGCSRAWMHHKGRNRHHYEYWTDMHPETKRYESVPMPRKYLVEMVMDRRAACMVYEGGKYDSGSALRYFERSRERLLMHPQTQQELSYLLSMLMEKGEKETFAYIRETVLKGKPFPWETE